MKGFPQRAQSFSPERNEWAPFTYEDGESILLQGEGRGGGRGGGREGASKGWGGFGGSVRFNPRRTMRDQGGREGNASDDALLKTWLTSVNKMDACDVHCYGRWRRPWFRCLVPPVQSSPTTLPSSPRLLRASMSLYESPEWSSRALCLPTDFFLSSCNKTLVDASENRWTRSIVV